MAKPGSKKIRKSGHQTERKLLSKLDRYERLKEFEESLLPQIRKDLEQGLKAENIIKKYSAHAAARLVTEALSATSQSGYGAAKEILDRELGKPKQQTETTHKFQNLPDSQLDALLKSGLAGIEDNDQTEDGDGSSH